jgi:hypothetical protein
MSQLSHTRRVFGFDPGDLLWLGSGIALAALIVLAATA